MIDDPRQEQACLYVLGALGPDEDAAFTGALGGDGELRALVGELHTAASVLPSALAPVAPRPELKRAIFEEIERRECIIVESHPEGEARDTPDSSSKLLKPLPAVGLFGWIGWAAAACLVFGIAYIYHSNTDVEEKLQAVQGERNDALREKKAAELRIKELEDRVAALQNGNLKGQQLIRLGPPENSAPVAIALWDQQKQTGTLLLDHLPAPAADKDYQLWIIDPKQASPIDCGVVAVAGNGVVTIPFSAKNKVGSIGKFAITLEQKGGVPAPKGTMVLIGG